MCHWKSLFVPHLCARHWFPKPGVVNNTVSLLRLDVYEYQRINIYAIVTRVCLIGMSPKTCLWGASRVLSCPHIWSIIIRPSRLGSHLSRESVSGFPQCVTLAFQFMLYDLCMNEFDHFHSFPVTLRWWSVLAASCPVARMTPLATGAHSTLSCWLLWIVGASCCHWPAVVVWRVGAGRRSRCSS